ACNANNPCANSLLCCNGACARCCDDRDCGHGESCRSGTCVTWCHANGDCPQGSCCALATGRCGLCPCVNDECPMGGRCCHGVCPFVPQGCCIDADCGKGYRCNPSDGSCYLYCTSDAECKGRCCYYGSCVECCKSAMDCGGQDGGAPGAPKVCCPLF